jgi:succinyl-diaminopimelate desuccinylase
MVHFLGRLEQSLDLSADPHPLLSAATCTVGTINGGVIINMIPDGCEAEVDIRLVPGMDHENVVQRVRDLGEGRVEVEVLDWKEPVESDPQARIIGISLDAVEQVTGVPRQPKGVSYFTDGSVLANRLQIPMVIIGPADTSMTHQPDEHVEVARLVQAVKAYLLIATRYLA